MGAYFGKCSFSIVFSIKMIAYVLWFLWHRNHYVGVKVSLFAV